MEGEFSVYWFDPDGYSHEELRFVDAKTAGDFAMAFTRRPAVQLGIVRRVIITDGGDFCVFEWKHGEGITYPTEEMLAAARAGTRHMVDLVEDDDDDSTERKPQ